MAGVLVMPAELDHLSLVIGGLQTKIETLTQTVRDNHDRLTQTVKYNQETSTEEHRKVHDIIDAMSDAIRTLTHTVAEMKPLTDDYRETRAEKRGAKRIITFLYVTVGSIAGAIISKLMEYFTVKPHL